MKHARITDKNTGNVHETGMVTELQRTRLRVL
jgi:hypothetical protein